MRSLWNPEIVERAARLQLLSRQLVWGFRFGQHRSPKVTRSIEFAEHKEYEPGDSIRSIDWRVYARTERLLVRRQQADTELAVIFVLDASADMALGDSQKPQWENTHLGRASTLIASLCMLCQRRGERFGLWIMGGEGYELHWLPPRSSKNQLVQIMTQLAAIQPTGKANIAASLQELSTYIPKRALIYMLSDWMEEPQEWGPILSVLAAYKSDLRFLHLFSQKEWGLDFEAVAQFISDEYQSSIAIDSVASRADFTQIVSEYQKEVLHWCGLSRAMYIPVPIEEPLMQPFIKMIKGSV